MDCRETDEASVLLPSTGMGGVDASWGLAASLGVPVKSILVNESTSIADFPATCTVAPNSSFVVVSTLLASMAGWAVVP